MLLAFAARVHCWILLNLVSTRTSRVLFCCFPVGQPGYNEIIPPRGQEFVFPSVELHESPLCPFLQHLEAPLNDSTTIWSIKHSSQFCIICKLAEGVLCPIFQLINEDDKQYRPQRPSLGYTTGDWPLAGFRASNHNHLSPAVQQVFSSSHSLLF